jgi:hypothetical protein
LGSTFLSPLTVFTVGADNGAKCCLYTPPGKWYSGGVATGSATVKSTGTLNNIGSWGANGNYVSVNGMTFNGIRLFAATSSATAGERILVIPYGSQTGSAVTNSSGVPFDIMYGIDSAYGYTLAVGAGTGVNQYRIATNGTSNFGIATSVPGFSVQGWGAYVVRYGDVLEAGEVNVNPNNFTYDYSLAPASINSYRTGLTSMFGNAINVDTYFSLSNTLVGIFKQPDNASFPLDIQANSRITGTLFTSGNLSVNGTSNTIAGRIYSDNLSLGTTATTHRLLLSTDSAAKPTTNTWTISSDERIKKFITLADLDVCYSTIKAMPLKYFEWDYGSNNVDVNNKDKHSLGYIAQDVEKVFPKAVDTVEEMYGFSNFKLLNTDQIIKMSHGALQKVMMRVEELEKKVAVLEGRL